jgi:hypothetical protein
MLVFPFHGHCQTDFRNSQSYIVLTDLSLFFEKKFLTHKSKVEHRQFIKEEEWAPQWMNVIMKTEKKINFGNPVHFLVDILEIKE